MLVTQVPKRIPCAGMAHARRTAAICTAVLVLVAASAHAQDRTRKSINELSATELNDYIHALGKLRDRSVANPADPTGYDFQAALHNDTFVGPCEHGNDHFLAWHRAHLYYFEDLLRASDPPRTSKVTIPYWDWIHPEASGDRFPAAFSTPGLTWPDRFMGPGVLPSDTLDIVRDETNWNLFGGFPKGSPLGDYGALELGPHNYMHSDFIGGRMGDPSTASEDPIYWSFHCFIDLAWHEWQRRNGFPPPTSGGKNLRGFGTQPKKTIDEFQKIGTLGYAYDYSPALEAAFGVDDEAVPMLAGDVRTLNRLSDEPIAETIRKSAALQFEFPEAAIPSPAETPESVRIKLADLAVPTAGSYTVRAYVHPKNVPFAAGDAEFARLYSAGYVSLWKARHAHVDDANADTPGHHPATCTARFNITRAMRKAAADHAGGLVLSLQVVPAPDPQTGRRELTEDLIKQIDFESVQMEVYRP